MVDNNSSKLRMDSNKKNVVLPTEFHDIIIRKSNVQDVKHVTKLLFLSNRAFFTHVIGLGKEERAKRILEGLFIKPGHRYSFEQIYVAALKKRVIGLVVFLPGMQIAKLNRRFFAQLLKVYGIFGKAAIFMRMLPLFFLKEGDKKSLTFSNLYFLPKYERTNYALSFISALEKHAEKEGYQEFAEINLIQDKINKKIFENLEYRVDSIVLESNKRIRFFGAGYQRMVKRL